jgi:hypothetical protein
MASCIVCIGGSRHLPPMHSACNREPTPRNLHLKCRPTAPGHFFLPSLHPFHSTSTLSPSRTLTSSSIGSPESKKGIELKVESFLPVCLLVLEYSPALFFTLHRCRLDPFPIPHSSFFLISVSSFVPCPRPLSSLLSLSFLPRGLRYPIRRPPYVSTICLWGGHTSTSVAGH